jgi:tRNA U34 2-thiouridine synthase MnmA/TrmU
MKDKKYFVSWSGGLDSTFLIYKLLSEGYSVCSSYVKIGNNEEKTTRELNSIKNIIPLFKDEFKNKFSYYGDNL